MRKVLMAVLVGAAVTVAACADSTAPNGFCQITASGQMICT